MRLSLFVLWGIVGWCITGVLRWRWWFRDWWVVPPLDTPERPPRPNWLVLGLIGVAGGVIGGWVFTVVFGPQPEPWIIHGPSPEPWMRIVSAAATSVGAFLGASLLTDLYGLATGNRKAPRG
ncbi:MAG: hypothetical protein H7Z16_04160 [Pyrinomonadaceae bacterium]|nr:hypothetical protein [Pyrinomonadaceae bacterium]